VHPSPPPQAAGAAAAPGDAEGGGGGILLQRQAKAAAAASGGAQAADVGALKDVVQKLCQVGAGKLCSSCARRGVEVAWWCG
jgi:hypothetical protein